MTFVVFLVLAVAGIFRATTADERERALKIARKHVQDIARRFDAWWQEIAPFRGALCERTRVAPVTPALVLINLVVALGMAFGAGEFGDPDTVVAWGGNLGPRTANGEWWRLVTALFVHSSGLHLLANLLALVSLGLVLERLVGPVAFTAVYFVSGIFASLFNLSAHPIAVSGGASGAVAGLYGLLLVALGRELLRQSPIVVPLGVVKTLGACAALFAVHSLATGGLGVVVVGVVSSVLMAVVVARAGEQRRAKLIRVAATVAVMVSLAAATAAPLRGITDATSDIEAVISYEENSSAVFREALEEFVAGRKNAKALADLIDLRIAPELPKLRARIESLTGVPDEQQALVTAAREYLQLRIDSWNTRSKALRRGGMAMLREADAKESASLAAFRRLEGRRLNHQ